MPGWSLSPPHSPRGSLGDGLWCQGLNPAQPWCPNHPGPASAPPVLLGQSPQPSRGDRGWPWGFGGCVLPWEQPWGSPCSGLGAPPLGLARSCLLGCLCHPVSPRGDPRVPPEALSSPWGAAPECSGSSPPFPAPLEFCSAGFLLPSSTPGAAEGLGGQSDPHRVSLSPQGKAPRSKAASRSFTPAFPASRSLPWPSPIPGVQCP